MRQWGARVEGVELGNAWALRSPEPTIGLLEIIRGFQLTPSATFNTVILLREEWLRIFRSNGLSTLQMIQHLAADAIS